MNLQTHDLSLFLRYLNALGLLALDAVLIYALYDQFFKQDLPCPLCLLQRVGFVACMVALLLNITYGSRPWHYGLLLLSAVFGATVALRQVSLHVIPGTLSYGEDFFGMHFYTWAFVSFVSIILLTSLLLLVPNQYPEHESFIAFIRQPLWVRLIVAAGLLVIMVNMGAALIECGFWVCDDNPESYKLLLPAW
ncbi:disulfide bond formation protein B [Endozoicomonas sp.]|uniref:disulfide bond formation protein B n=1 Tax=Endozoicomonas sp. TaxID=1892382 RepID=UPI002883DEE1|nr:disulfide bond formation protein B [Endozoicomonas sp.]